MEKYKNKKHQTTNIKRQTSNKNERRTYDEEVRGERADEFASTRNAFQFRAKFY